MVPGPMDDKGRRRAQERLQARNSHLATSLADHAERVAKRSLAGDRIEEEPAAARLEALRRRIAARCRSTGRLKDNDDRREHLHDGLPKDGPTAHGHGTATAQRAEGTQDARCLAAAPSGDTGGSVDLRLQPEAQVVVRNTRASEAQIVGEGRHTLPSIEDVQIQFLGRRRLVQGEGGPGIASATAAAARSSAWHSNEGVVTGARPS